MLTKDNAILLVIDVQGKLATLMHNQKTLFQNIIRMIQGAKVLNLPIIWTEQLPDKLGETTPEVKETLRNLRPFVKKTFSCCGDKNFMNHLLSLNRKQVIVTGIETHICVYQTVIDLIKESYEVHVVRDAVSSRIEGNYHLGLEKMKDVGAQISSVEMSLFEMLQVAEGDDFKQIIKIVK